jgi:murein endopeptidase
MTRRLARLAGGAAAAALLALCLAPETGANTAYLGEVEVGGAQWRQSISVGSPQRGALIYGVQLPPQGADFFTWDFPLGTSPSRPWRRWGADATVAATLRVIAEFRAANPGAPRIGIGDLSRPFGGPFGRRYGGLGHASHQNGLDVDVLYPRSDRLERAPTKASQIDRALAQDLVARLVDAGAQYVFVGPRTQLAGPKRVVRRLVFHDDHLHVRWRP